MIESSRKNITHIQPQCFFFNIFRKQEIIETCHKVIRIGQISEVIAAVKKNNNNQQFNSEKELPSCRHLFVNVFFFIFIKNCVESC